MFTAIGESADLAAFPTAMVSDDGWLQVGRDGRTAHEMVYVGGDLSHGPSTVVAAIGDGRRAAAAGDLARRERIDRRGRHDHQHGMGYGRRP